MPETLHGNGAPGDGGASGEPHGRVPEALEGLTPEDRLLGALCYPVPLVALVMLFTERIRIRYMKYHAIQGIVYGLALVVPYVFLGLLANIPIVGWIIGRFVKPALHLVSFLWMAGGCWLGYRAWLGALVTVPPLEKTLGRLLEQ